MKQQHHFFTNVISVVDVCAKNKKIGNGFKTISIHERH